MLAQPSTFILDWLARAERGSPSATWIYWEPSTSTYNVGYGICLGKWWLLVPGKYKAGTPADWLKAHVGKCPPSPYRAPSLTEAGTLLANKVTSMRAELRVDISGLPQAWQDLTLDLVYQFGPGAVRKSQYLAHLLAGRREAAALAALGFRRVGGAINAGLVARRANLVRYAFAGVPAPSPWDKGAVGEGWTHDDVTKFGIPSPGLKQGTK